MEGLGGGGGGGECVEVWTCQEIRENREREEEQDKVRRDRSEE